MTAKEFFNRYIIFLLGWALLLLSLSIGENPSAQVVVAGVGLIVFCLDKLHTNQLKILDELRK